MNLDSKYTIGGLPQDDRTAMNFMVTASVSYFSNCITLGILYAVGTLLNFQKWVWQILFDIERVWYAFDLNSSRFVCQAIIAADFDDFVTA